MSPLPRVLEPEVMDTPEEASDYDAMDHAGPNRHRPQTMASNCDLSPRFPGQHQHLGLAWPGLAANPAIPTGFLAISKPNHLKPFNTLTLLFDDSPKRIWPENDLT